MSTSAADSDALRPLTMDDLDWVLDLSGARRERIAAFAPQFWRPAPDARQRHATFLSGQVADERVLSLQTDHGFMFAVPRGDAMDIDDMALDDETRWSGDGRRLLRAAAGVGALRLVCPVPEPERTQAAVDLGMSVEEVWWHRDLAPSAQPRPVLDRVLAVEGGAGHLVDPPPVYAPGGPVALTREVASAEALGAIEKLAATRGATVSVVSQRPDDRARAELLQMTGYKRTTDFYFLRPAAGT